MNIEVINYPEFPTINKTLMDKLKGDDCLWFLHVHVGQQDLDVKLI